MASERKKVRKIKNALKTAARRLPVRARIRGGVRSTMNPLPGEVPIVTLRVRVLECNNLLAKDKSGTSDPFVVVSLAGNKHTTSVVKKTLNPTYDEKEATFDIPIYLSLSGRLGVLELVVWDKDKFKKDYLGEASLHIEEWFSDGSSKGFDDLENAAFTADLVSTRASTSASGSIRARVGYVNPENVNHSMSFDEVHEELLRRARNAHITLVSAPPTEGIGTIRTHDPVPTYEDDGMSSDEGSSDEDVDEREDESTLATPLSLPPAMISSDVQDSSPDATPSAEVPDLKVVAPSPVTPPPETPDASTATVTPLPPARKAGKLPRVFKKRPTLTPASTASSVTTASSVGVPPSPGSRPMTPTTPGTPSTAKRSKFPRKWSARNRDFNFNSANDILGIVMLEIQGATDLPKIRNMTRIGWDMDAFVVISFGKKVFRTRVIRHSLNPVWDEKLLFHVRRYEKNFKVQLTVLDWDKLTSNDHVGDSSFDVAELLQDAPEKDEKTGLYPELISNGMKTFNLKIGTAKEVPWESKHNPVLTVRAKFQPYDALRQQFWRQYLKQYDSDDNGDLSRLELTSMLDSLGSTLSAETVDSFFTQHGKNPKEDEVTINEAIQCLEEELCRPTNEKKKIDAEGVNVLDTSISATPLLMNYGNGGSDQIPDIGLGNINFSGPHLHPSAIQAGTLSQGELQPAYPTEPSQRPLAEVVQPVVDSASTRVPIGYKPASMLTERQMSSSTSSSEAEDANGMPNEDQFERIINVKNCPLCHRPRINKRAEVDIVTHLAVCASQDWARVDRIVVGNFVTASQAQRKWYTKVMGKISSGNYKLGANSANIIVQNRMTGQLEEEKMQVYVRLGIRLLYKGARSRIEGARARRLLKSLSIKQGLKYDSPESTHDIPAFIQFHRLNVDEIALPISEYKTFNEFFYRKLKPDARPVETPENPNRLVSGADCRMMAFETVNEATKLWIKGREFSVMRLLGEAYRDQVDMYNGGALAVFRLAPQDYHRFHSPVDGKIGPMTYISGEYYTVNPQAVRTALDVYGENARKIVPIDSPQFGRVMCVCIGAMMVGTIRTTVDEGDEVKRGQEFGYFAFGGSTIVCLFEKGVIEWDEDLLINGRASLETLVRVGMGIGNVRKPPNSSASSATLVTKA